ncbi:hypothetical protein SLNWT_5367 [Streptomyces albus]|uniref:Uncharacterized protein n=1 Tax=Streptomyces albus (strain ATCC 21838 / DSM 41398 / FERM P-419 / JCM 4703 / NBRC 107858) TaxID=1081613 RepID=A0A0B5ESH4_STRA4|nr:hypothetical protein SLNWT_5367 [Streptomyces albus]AOU80046.1 hypothetical protein SLNHY_5355 [Streptomyces albus]AYN35762.1 hypothetical protein DUI70_5268 [Streptomyces albus]
MRANASGYRRPGYPDQIGWAAGSADRPGRGRTEGSRSL